MKNKIYRTISIVLGLFLIVYAANHFLHFFSTSYGKMPEFSQDYLDAVAPFLPALYILEIIIGIMLIINKWVPFISVVLVPLSLSFLIFNFTNGGWNILSAAFVSLANLLILLHHREKFKPLFT